MEENSSISRIKDLLSKFPTEESRNDIQSILQTLKRLLNKKIDEGQILTEKEYEKSIELLVECTLLLKKAASKKDSEKRYNSIVILVVAGLLTFCAFMAIKKM